MNTTRETIQLINTAVLKSKEKQVDLAFDKKLEELTHSKGMVALDIAINHLSKNSNISRDQAAIQIIELIAELDSLWEDYVLVEGLNKIKELLKKTKH